MPIDDVVFLSESYTYKPDAVASTPGTSFGTNTPGKAVDYDKDSTYWETTDAAPSIKIDLGVAYEVDSLWFKSYNVSKYRLYYSSDDIAYFAAFAEQDGNANGVDFLFSFTAQTKRYWRLDITQETAPGENTLIYEIMLMEHRLTLNHTDESLPSRADVVQNDRIGGNYQLSDGSATSYAGQRIFVDIVMEFDYTPKANRDNLYDLFLNPYIRPPLTIYPNDEYPEGIFAVIWKSTIFNLVYTIGYKGSGFSGRLEFLEHYLKTH